jgi:hypothetical protein
MGLSIARMSILAATCGVLCCMSQTVAQANDTSLNVGVSPPRLLGDDLIPVRMAAEQITIHFGKERTQVEVEFTFHNLSEDELDFWAGFPDEDLLYRYLWSAGTAEDLTKADELAQKYRVGGDVESDTAGNVEHFKAWTRPAGQPASANVELPWEVVRIESLASTLPTPQDEPAVSSQWVPADLNSLLLCRAFELHLEAGKDLIVGHSYDTATGSNVDDQALFQYQLVTGRNWQGTIGEATIDVILEPDLADAGLLFDSPDLLPYYPVTEFGKNELRRIAPGHYRAVWRDFEPEGAKGWIYLATPPRSPEEQPEDSGTSST